MAHCAIQMEALNKNDDRGQKEQRFLKKRGRVGWGRLPPAFGQCDAETHAICSDCLDKHIHTTFSKSKTFVHLKENRTQRFVQTHNCTHLLISCTWSRSCHYVITATVVLTRNYHFNEMQQLHLYMLLRDKRKCT